MPSGERTPRGLNRHEPGPAASGSIPSPGRRRGRWQRFFSTGCGLAGMAALLASAAEPEVFSGQQAYTHLQTLCELGPRPSGSAAMESQRVLLTEHFAGLGGRVTRQPFAVKDRRTGQSIRMENLLVTWHADRSERIIIGAHYDTRPYPDRDPVDPRGRFIGANDGASGVALLMELARWMRTVSGVGVDFVLFDAEEYVVDRRDPYCLGSTFFARQYAAAQRAGTLGYRYRCGVVVDMVADADLELWQEQHSVEWPDTRPVVDSIWEVARRLHVHQFRPRPKYTVEDDHVPLRMIGGIPTCDIIDFDYPHWHTTQDVIANCSGESLAAVGTVLLEWLRLQR